MRICFVHDSTGALTGAHGHIEAKVALLRQLGHEVELVAAPSVQQWLRSPHATLKSSTNGFKDADLVYARIAPRTIPLIEVWQQRENRPTICEFNGYVDEDFRLAVARPAVRALMSRVLQHRATVAVGDHGYAAYASHFSSGGGSIRWSEVPLPCPRPEQLRLGARVHPVVRFIGSLSPWQGVHQLTAAWRLASVGDLTLEIVGDGPLLQELQESCADVPDIRFLGRLAEDRASELASTSAALVAPYTNARGRGFGLSSLKTLMYACTDRPMITSTRDSLLRDLGDADLVHSWDGQRVDSLASGLEALAEQYSAGLRAQERAERVLAVRGPEPVRASLARAIALVCAS